MSVRLMSLVFEAEIHDLEYTKDGEPRKTKASTAKLLLLAISDHANDEGESAYPGYTRLEKKTCLSRQGISDTLEALKANEYISISEDPSRLGTNNYTVNLRKLVKPLDQASQATLPAPVKPLDSIRPSIINKPSAKPAKSIQNSGSIEEIKAAAIHTVDEILKQELNPRGLEKQSIQNRFEAAFRISPSWDGQKWRDFDSWLLSQERKGRTIEAYADWWKSDPFREKLTAYIEPSKIKQNWNLAFVSSTAITRVPGGAFYG